MCLISVGNLWTTECSTLHIDQKYWTNVSYQLFVRKILNKSNFSHLHLVLSSSDMRRRVKPTIAGNYCLLPLGKLCGEHLSADAGSVKPCSVDLTCVHVSLYICLSGSLADSGTHSPASEVVGPAQSALTCRWQQCSWATDSYRASVLGAQRSLVTGMS